MKNRTILYVHRGEKHEDPIIPNFARHLKDAGYEVETVAIRYGAKAKGVPQVFRLGNLSDYRAVVAAEYYLVWALALKLWLIRAKTPLIAMGFNQSSRLLQTGRRVIDRMLNRIWRRVALLVVHSRSEARLFAVNHDIPLEKFAFSHWGYDLPAFGRDIYAAPFPQFVSMIGRNNRDIETFYEAVSKAGANGVLVTSDYMMTPQLRDAKPANVEILIDLPMALCLDVIGQSAVHLILVKDDARGAGHISAVSAMLLKKPQIFSNVDTLDDYLIDGFNGLAVPMHDAESTAKAIRKLLVAPSAGDALGENGFALATQWMSNDNTARHTANLILSSIENGRKPDDVWTHTRNRIATPETVLP